MSLLKYQKTQWTKSVSGILPVGVICLFLVLISTSHMFCLIIPDVDYSPITFSFASYLLNLLISFFVTFSFVQLIFCLVFFFYAGIWGNTVSTRGHIGRILCLGP